VEARGIFCYNKIMSIKRVGVLRGGTGKQYATSLQKGGEVISCIFENLADKYKTFDILIDKDGVWHLNGIPILPSGLAQKVDVVWNTSHPSFSNILDSLSIPNINAGDFSSILQNNKNLLREHLKNIDIEMPRYIISPKNAQEVFEKFPAPWIVKFLNEIKVVKTFDELAEIIKDKEDVIVEEFIPGKIASMHSVPGFRMGDLPAQTGGIYTFPLVNSFGIFSKEEKEKLATVTKKLHKHIGVKHYLKSDFVLTPRGKIYLLQINGTPNLKSNSHFSEVCESVGAKTHHVVEHILEQQS
jgi:D-alanine-D-alanine ligase-like ATP-grasp enzyme